MNKPRLYIALPIMDELENISGVLEIIEAQTYKNHHIFICVNQPDAWWDDEEKQEVCLRNELVLKVLQKYSHPAVTIIDRSSRGHGWTGKQYGIGWARKILMDAIVAVAGDEDIILSLDADTVFGAEYFESVADNMQLIPEAVALSVPYYHYLTGDEMIDRAMLRYEMYMRCYALNMFRISIPYCFTALGSAIAVPVWAYKAVGGMSPKLSGEDFYFLQKLSKFGRVIHWNNQMVFPAARLSDRVFFGTGPALIKGVAGDWESYPVYTYRQFDLVSVTYKSFPRLFHHDLPTPMDDFLRKKSGLLPWAKLRNNSTTEEGFVKACSQHIDGLRILQFLKENRPNYPETDEEALASLLQLSPFHKPELAHIISDLNFSHSSLDDLNDLRDHLFNLEDQYRKSDWMKASGLNALYN